MFDKLSEALTVYKSSFTEKQFKNKLNKASKFFLDDIAKSTNKKKSAKSPKKTGKKK
jgi:hypothetical protein